MATGTQTTQPLSVIVSEIGLDDIGHLMRQVTPSLSIAEARAIVCGCLFFASKHSVKATSNLFEANQLSEVKLNRLRLSEHSDSDNWVWIFAVCPVDTLIRVEVVLDVVASNDRLEELAILAFRKSKAVQFGRIMSKFMDLQDPFCRFGQTVGYWLHKLYVARGVPRSEFPDCLRRAYEEFLNWKGFQWSYPQPTLPFHRRPLNAGVTPTTFPYALPETIHRPVSIPLAHLGEGGLSRSDADFQMALRISKHERKTEIFNEYINSGFDGTLVQFSDFFLFDTPTMLEPEP